jgi:ABC-2 type transport system ATP-binding protein
MTHGGEPLVEVRGLTRRFGALTAVGELSLDVFEGELFGIVGPDGAGKTTTLRMLAGVLPPSAGDARIAGIGVARQAERVKPFMAYMAQRFGLYEDLTVRENIDFYADLYRVPAADRAPRLERLYRFSGLGEFEQRLAGALSGGMKQKLALCCSLIHRPRLLLLDEPTFGVDPISRRDLWLILHEMVAEGTTVIVSTSYLDEAERCDRVALLHEGRALAIDSPGALQRTLEGRLFAVATASPRPTRDALRAHPAVARATLFGDAIHVVLAAHAAPAALREVVGVTAVQPIEVSLEDVFIEHVAGNGAAA